MEQIRQRFINEIAASLAGAAESDAKAEMVEELADNLTGRYEDMTAAGIGPEEAFARAMGELGDVDELTAYLNSLEPETAGKDELDELVRAVSDMGRAAADMGRKAVDKAEDFLRSDTARSAVREGKKAVQKAGDIIRKAVEQGAIAWNSRNVKLDFTEDEQEQSVPSGELMSLDVELPNGDVDVRPALEPDAPVLIEGDADRLEIFTSEEGVLTVRQRYTASGQFFSFRGISGTDVSLTVPAKKWDSIRIATSCGDVGIDGLAADRIAVSTASGDIDCRIDACGRGELKTASGDIRCRGNWQSILAETVSGDVEQEGAVDEARVTTVSGDVEMEGTVTGARVRSMSGDIQLRSGMLPRELDLSSKSGDIDVRLPGDAGPFHARLDTVSGQARYDFPGAWTSASAPEDGVPAYKLASISGDVSLKKLV